MNAGFVRANVRAMEGYTPGEQPDGGQRIVKLNTNENPYPPSPAVMAAIAAIAPDALRRYPNPTADPLRDAAARLHGVTRQQIIAGNGSDDILTIATRTFVPPGGSIAFPDPTYSLYPVLARLEDARAIPVPWKRDWALPIDALVKTNASAIYLANPNAPSGTWIAPAEVAKLARVFSGALLIDEAYVDFAPEHCVGLIRDFPNVIVSRTLSKAYSLAGLRCGYGLAQAEVIREMMKVKDSYNCDAIAIAAGAAALDDQAYARAQWEKIKSERARVAGELARLGWPSPPSQANFLLATAAGGAAGSARDYYQRLKQLGVLVRYFDMPGLQDKLRITIGQPGENDALLEAIRKISAGQAA